MIRARHLFFLVICSFGLWSALCVWCPRLDQTSLFHRHGSELFSDFGMPRTCAQEENPYAAEAVEPKDRCYAIIGYQLAGLFPADVRTGGLVFTLTGAALLVLALGVLRTSDEGTDGWVLPALMVSAPFVFNLERANQVWLAAAGVAMFLAWHESESRWKRGVALLSLALASALKITPGVFSLLLLKERRWRDFLAFALAGAVMTLLPFALHGDMGLVGDWLARMREHTEHYRNWKAWGTGQLLWIPMRRVGSVIGFVPSVWRFGQWVDFAVGGMALYGVFKATRRRDEVFFLAVSAMVLPCVAQYYTVLYLFPALVLIGKDRLSAAGAALWFLLLTPLQPNVLRFHLNIFVANAALCALIAYRLIRVLGKRSEI